MQDTLVRSLGQEDPLQQEMVTHSDILAQKIPWTEEPGRLQSMELQRVRYDLAWIGMLQLPKSQMAFFSYIRIIVYTDFQSFSAATFRNYLSCIVHQHLALHNALVCLGDGFFHKSHEPTPASFKLFFSSFLTSLTLYRIEKLGLSFR